MRNTRGVSKSFCLYTLASKKMLNNFELKMVAHLFVPGVPQRHNSSEMCWCCL